MRGTCIDGIKVFKGIPYGAPTSGKNRFMPPVKPAAWTGTRDALAFGPTAPQTGDNSGTTAAGSPAQQSEDCLVLNVFTPGLNDGRKRPVMVWLHGGGFSSGSGSGRILDGTSLAHTHDVVVVTINHRLNVFGYTYLGDAMGSDFALSSSAGLLDIVAALEWVRDNIAGFGGDPNLVTIFGQSGGGRKVATLMSMPGAKGLFHRAIIESGAVLAFDDARRCGAVHGSAARRTGTEGGAGSRACRACRWRACSTADAAVQKKITLREPGMTANSPMVDGKAIPGASLGSDRARAFGRHSLADRLRAHRGDALRPADAREAGARRSRAAGARVEAARRRSDARRSRRSAKRIPRRRRGICGS